MKNTKHNHDTNITLILTFHRCHFTICGTNNQFKINYVDTYLKNVLQNASKIHLYTEMLRLNNLNRNQIVYYKIDV